MVLSGETMSPSATRTLILVVLLSACREGDPQRPERPERPADETGGVPPLDTGGADTEDLPGWDGELPDPTAWVFGLDEVHRVELRISEAAEISLRRDPYTYVEAALDFDGHQLDPVGLRLKGKIGSFRDLDGKAGFKLDFNRFVPGQELSGLERLNLDNMVQDPSCNHDRVAYRIYNAVGIPAPRVGYAQVLLNGDLYGVYALIEDYDDVLLDWAYEDSSGNLYDGDYLVQDDGSYLLADFSPSRQANFQLDEGEDVGLADIQAVTEALRETCETEAFMDAAGAVVDLEHFAMLWAGEIWVGQWDGYAINGNNYRVYFDPADGGRAHLHPWDHDNAFSDGDWVLSPSGDLAQCCKRDEACHALFHEALLQIGQAAGALGLLGEVDDALQLIEPYLIEDPRREFSMDTLENRRSDLLFWLQVRSNVLSNYPSL